MEALKEVKAVVMDKTGTITKGNFEVQKCISLGAWKEEELLVRLQQDVRVHPRIRLGTVLWRKQKNVL